jgi:hypothetical protein
MANRLVGPFGALMCPFCAREVFAIFRTIAEKPPKHCKIYVFFSKASEDPGSNEKARLSAGYLTDIAIKVWLRGQDLNL